MYESAESMINKFLIKIRKSDMALIPDGNIIFEKVNRRSLVKKQTEESHNSVSRGMFVSNR